MVYNARAYAHAISSRCGFVFFFALMKWAIILNALIDRACREGRRDVVGYEGEGHCVFRNQGGQTLLEMSNINW